MSRSPHPSLLIVAFLVSCGSQEDDARAAARDLVARFEQALRRGDRGALRDVVTLESRPAIDAMPLPAIADKAPLVLLDVVARAGTWHVGVRDPNANDKEGAFVVVQENGSLRVDLVASAGLTAREVPLPGAATRTVMRPLTPQQLEQAAHMAQQKAAATATPPR